MPAHPEDQLPADALKALISFQLYQKQLAPITCLPPPGVVGGSAA
jgi:hypothetical protein